MKRLSLLFVYRFPVMPKSFPVNLDKEFRLKTHMDTAQDDDASVFQVKFSDFPCILP